jgi:hypothetical protein
MFNSEANNFATKADIDRLEARIDRMAAATKADIGQLEVRIESLDKRLAVIQWIGVIFLALNGSLIGTLLWVLASVLVRV